jgi:hypothetical protein
MFRSRAAICVIVLSTALLTKAAGAAGTVSTYLRDGWDINRLPRYRAPVGRKLFFNREIAA